MIKDTVQLQGFPQMKLPKLKGTVEIKLHNPTTGKTTIERGENMITNAMSDIFASNYCGALDYRKLLPLYNKMYGGILCFSKPLDVSSQDAADDYFIPDSNPTDGNPLTAHAGQNSFSTQDDDYTRGTPSNVTVSDGIATMSWEWGLSAGNGTISSLALTHTDVGDAGTGSTSNAFKAIKPVINACYYRDLNNTYWGMQSSDYQTIRVIKDGYAYSFVATTTTNMAITKIPIAFEETGLVASSPFINMDSSLCETHNIDVTDLGLTTGSGYIEQPFYFYDRNNTVWFLFNTDVSRTFKYMTVNLTTWATTSGTVTTDSVSVGSFLSNNYTGCPPSEILFDGTYMYLPRSKPSSASATAGNVAGVLRMKLPPNQADQTTAGFTSSCKGFGGIFIPNGSHKVLVADSLVINNGTLYPTATDSYWNAYYALSAQPITIYNNKLTSLTLQRNGNGGWYYVGVSKFYLGTKYNLSSAVTKTPSQSMIVTYTIQEVASNE